MSQHARRLAKCTALALTVGAVAAQTSGASPSVDLRSPDARDAAREAQQLAAPATLHQDLRSPDAVDAARRAQQQGSGTKPYTVRVVEVAQPAGFDWGDAGIGGGFALGLIAVGAGTMLALARRRHPAPKGLSAA